MNLLIIESNFCLSVHERALGTHRRTLICSAADDQIDDAPVNLGAQRSSTSP